MEAINQYGSVNISYPRLALIGGQEDPWRYVTPLAPDVPDRLNESSTVSEPIIVIEGAVHHWDEVCVFCSLLIRTWADLCQEWNIPERDYSRITASACRQCTSRNRAIRPSLVCGVATALYQ